MNYYFNKIVRTFWIVVISLILLGGCATNEYKQYLKNSSIEKVSSNNVIITSAYAYETDKGMVVHGRLNRRYEYATRSRSLPGHVDIDISDPGGTVLYKTITNYRSKSKVRINRNFRFEYLVAIPFIPTDGYAIRVSFHEKV